MRQAHVRLMLQLLHTASFDLKLFDSALDETVTNTDTQLQLIVLLTQS
jgi:ribonuclease D